MQLSHLTTHLEAFLAKKGLDHLSPSLGSKELGGGVLDQGFIDTKWRYLTTYMP